MISDNINLDFCLQENLMFIQIWMKTLVLYFLFKVIWHWDTKQISFPHIWVCRNKSTTKHSTKKIEKFIRLWLAIGTLAGLLARLHIKMRSWHAFGTSLVCLWHVDTFIGKLAHKNEKLTRLWHDFGMLARWY